MKRNLTLAFGLLSASAVFAAPLSPSEALSRASQDGAMRMTGKSYNPSPVYTVKTAKDAAAAYVFPSNSGKGFMILSANDVAFPVLGYSENGTFDYANIPDNMKWWLSELARQIEWASENTDKVARAPMAPTEWSAISPLVATTWDQGSPYNLECPTPTNSTTHCYTGCVATSMAQAMNYFKYPEKGQGVKIYSASKLRRTLAIDFSEVTYDWANMLDSYRAGSYNDTQALAVATLMKSCGYSVEMDYGTEASGAQGYTIGTALRNYFNYDQDCHSEYRVIYSMSDWSEKIYNNLKNIGPVVINGRDPGEAGHSFICDGYDGNGYFHFNWGWSGVSDGYFSLDALNPDDMGIGGYGSGFNFGQNAIFGIQPPTGEPQKYFGNLVQLGNMTAVVSGSTITVGSADYGSTEGWSNYCDITVSGKFGLSFALQSGEGEAIIVDGKLGNRETVSVAPQNTLYNPTTYTATIPDLANGTYKVTSMFLPDGGEWEEILTPWGYNNFVYLTKSDSGITITRPAYGELQITKAEIASQFYYDYNTLLKVTFNNPTDKELTQGLMARLLNGSQISMIGPNTLVTVGPNETVEKEFVVKFQQNAGSFSNPTDYTLNFFNPDRFTDYGNFGTYTMVTGPKTVSLSLKTLDVVDAPLTTVAYAGSNREAYNVADAADFDIDFSYSVRVGYFAGFTKLTIYKVDPNQINTLISVPAVDQIFQESAFLERGEESGDVVKVNFPEAEPGVLYAIVATYNNNKSWANLGTTKYFMTGLTGVNDIINDAADEQAEYFNLQGMRVAEPKAGELVIRKTGARTEKIIMR